MSFWIKKWPVLLKCTWNYHLWPHELPNQSHWNLLNYKLHSLKLMIMRGRRSAKREYEILSTAFNFNGRFWLFSQLCTFSWLQMFCLFLFFAGHNITNILDFLHGYYLANLSKSPTIQMWPCVFALMLVCVHVCFCVSVRVWLFRANWFRALMFASWPLRQMQPVFPCGLVGTLNWSHTQTRVMARTLRHAPDCALRSYHLWAMF